MQILVTLILLASIATHAKDITDLVFGPLKDEGLLPAAYGDFDSDELTDLFILKNDSRMIQILFGSDTEPLLRPGPACWFHQQITSLVPGDFDGDGIMDVLFTTRSEPGSFSNLLNVFVHYGTGDTLNCTNPLGEPLAQIYGEPLALDVNRDLIIDLFGLDRQHQRKFWIFNQNRTMPQEVPLGGRDHAEIPLPHSHAVVDYDGDFIADLVLSVRDGFEVWRGTHSGFEYTYSIRMLPSGNHGQIGQSIFMDVELRGALNLVAPACLDHGCVNSSIVVRKGDTTHFLNINFKDDDNMDWHFPLSTGGRQGVYDETITLRSTDFNLDGYPDLLATLENRDGLKATFLLENVACFHDCRHFSRTFLIRWRALAPVSNNTLMGSFYDFYQDGIMDVLLVQRSADGKSYRPIAFRNSLDYDANFVKVIVLTGLVNKGASKKTTPLGRRKRTFGTNLPGPRIEYGTTTQEGVPQHGASAQLSQSAYFALQLPYSIFGLGRTPNFVDSLTVGLLGRKRTWTQLIPNSQMIVVPWPVDDPSHWKAQLFVTPSKLILNSVYALSGICGVIMLIIFVLHMKEKWEDKVERRQESKRLHFGGTK